MGSRILGYIMLGSRALGSRMQVFNALGFRILGGTKNTGLQNIFFKNPWVHNVRFKSTGF